MPADLSPATLTPRTWAWSRARLSTAWRWAIGWAYEKAGLPGMVRPMDFYDRKTGNVVSIDVNRMFTVIRIGERDYWFQRRDGKFDGTGTSYSCPAHDTIAASSTHTDAVEVAMAYQAGRAQERATLLASLIEKLEGMPRRETTCYWCHLTVQRDVLTLLRTEAENG